MYDGFFFLLEVFPQGFFHKEMWVYLQIEPPAQPCVLFMIAGPCTFPQFNFSYFYLYTEGHLGSIVNLAHDRIQFVA